MTYIQYANRGEKIHDVSLSQLHWPLIGGQLMSSDTVRLGPEGRQSTYITEKYRHQDNGNEISVSKALYPDGYRSISILDNGQEFNQGYRPDGSINYTVSPETNNNTKNMTYFDYTHTNNIPKGEDGLIARTLNKVRSAFTGQTEPTEPVNTDNWDRDNGTVTVGGKTYATNNRNDVIALQDYLINQGYNLGVTKGTGYFGKNTQAALNKHFASPTPVTTQSSTQPQPQTSPSFFTNAKNAVTSWFAKDNQEAQAPINSWDQNTGAISLDGKAYNTNNRNDVVALQNYLIGKGYNVGSTGADGKFGRNTGDALQSYISARASNTNTPAMNTDEARKLIGDLVNYSANPHLQAAYQAIDPTSQFGQNDQEVIKQLQARFNLPVTGVLDDKTLERFNHENSLRGKIENVQEAFARPGSVGRQFARAAAQAVLPDGWVKSKKLFRGDFSDTQQQQFDYILKSAAGAAPGIYSLSGAQYSDGYAPGHANYDANMVRRAVDILSGNDQQSGAFSIGGATVSTHMFPNGKKGSLLTDRYDFNNAAPENIEQQKQAIQNDPNLTQEEKDRKLAELNTSIAAIEARVAKGQGDRSSTNTYYGLFEDGTPMTEEDIQWALDDRSNYPAKIRKDGSTYRPALANHADINDMMYTTWTGKGNTYMGNNKTTYYPTKAAEIFADTKNKFSRNISTARRGGQLNYLKYIH